MDAFTLYNDVQNALSPTLRTRIASLVSTFDWHLRQKPPASSASDVAAQVVQTHISNVPDDQVGLLSFYLVCESLRRCQPSLSLVNITSFSDSGIANKVRELMEAGSSSEQIKQVVTQRMMSLIQSVVAVISRQNRARYEVSLGIIKGLQV